MVGFDGTVLENYPATISNINEWKEASNLPDRPIGAT
jgi:hypothetical protein